MGVASSKRIFSCAEIPSSFSSIVLKDLQGKEIPLSQWDGKVKLLVNIASKCGLTKGQLAGLEKLRDTIGTDNFEILGIPCGQFANQESKDPAETLDFCERAKISFPVFMTSDVNGAHTNPAVLYCKWNSDQFFKRSNASDSGQLADIGWNYGKFLLDTNNGVYKYVGPRTDPVSLEEDIRKLIHREVQGSKRGADNILRPL